MKIATIVLYIISLTSCSVKYSLDNFEGKGSPNTLTIQEGKKLWFIYRDSAGRNYADENGIHKSLYETKKSFNTFKTTVSFFDTSGILLDTSSVLEYARSVEKIKNGKYVEMKFLGKSGNLVSPSYMKYARMTQKHLTDSIWIERYYGADNLPRCGELGYETKKEWVKLIDAGQSGYMQIKEHYLLDCKRNKIR
jgi:hypothetical protein